MPRAGRYTCLVALSARGGEDRRWYEDRRRRGSRCTHHRSSEEEKPESSRVCSSSSLLLLPTSVMDEWGSCRCCRPEDLTRSDLGGPPPPLSYPRIDTYTSIGGELYTRCSRRYVFITLSTLSAENNSTRSIIH